MRVQVERLLGDEAAKEVETIIVSAAGHQTRSRFAAMLGVASLLFGATGVFVQLQSALNKVWHVEPDPRLGGVRNFIEKRILSFGLVLGLGFLLLVSLLLSAAIVAFSNFISGWLNSEASAMLVEGINVIISFAVVTTVFAAIFKVMPDAKIRWKDVWVGAAVTSILFALGKFVIGFYLGNSDVSSAYGAAGSLAIVLIWIYYSSVILLAGAEFTQVLYSNHGKGPRPEPGAMKVEHITVRE